MLNDALHLGFTILLALALVLLMAWFFLRWMGRSSPLSVNSRHIKVLDRVAVDRDKCLVLISVGDKTMLVAMSASSVEKLCEFDLAEKDIYFREATGQQSFSDLFRQMMPPSKKGGGEG